MDHSTSNYAKDNKVVISKLRYITLMIFVFTLVYQLESYHQPCIQNKYIFEWIIRDLAKMLIFQHAIWQCQHMSMTLNFVLSTVPNVNMKWRKNQRCVQLSYFYMIFWKCLDLSLSQSDFNGNNAVWDQETWWTVNVTENTPT